MTFIVPILETSPQKDSVSSLSHIMLAVDLEENSDHRSVFYLMMMMIR